MSESVKRPPPLLVIVGPTASGKSSLAIELALRLRGEIVSADSVQVYRGFDVGSGKVSLAELARAPHHLLDVAEPDAPLEANQWAELARAVIQGIGARGNLPIVCGGTFLWVRALLYGLAEAPRGDRAVRARHEDVATKLGRAALHEQLARVDPKSAERLHPNDFVRVSRALEVFELSGRTMSSVQEEHGFRDRHYDARLLGVKWDGAAYDERVRVRVGEMLRQGLVDEVRQLIEQGHEAARAMDSVGYRQTRDFLRAERTQDTELLLDDIVRATRIFARRQRTWLKSEAIHWIAPDVLGDARALDRLAAELASSLAPPPP